MPREGELLLGVDQPPVIDGGLGIGDQLGDGGGEGVDGGVGRRDAGRRIGADRFREGPDVLGVDGEVDGFVLPSGGVRDGTSVRGALRPARLAQTKRLRSRMRWMSSGRSS